MALKIDANDDAVSGFDVTVNGRQVTQRAVRGLDDAPAGGFSRSLDVPLEAGENRIRIVAKNAVGQTAEELLLTLSAEGALNKNGKLYLVAAGVDAYPKLGDRAALAYAGADATALHDTLTARARPLFTDIKSVLLVKGAAREPTQANIVDALDLFREAGPEDTVILFLAGHGVNDGPDYLFLPQDAETQGGNFRSASVVKWTQLAGRPAKRERPAHPIHRHLPFGRRL